MSLFSLQYESKAEIEAPLSKIWDFFLDLKNWPKWDYHFEEFVLNGKFELGAQIKGKVKRRNCYLPMTVTNFRRNEQFEFFIQSPFLSQAITIILKEITPRQTEVTLKSTGKGLVAFFCKYIIDKQIQRKWNGVFCELQKLQDE